ncbi:MAG TPA: lipopolysaccharide biosynthesis protein [Phenylobacterium sp.]|uniref:lipopolysaccharide biosynthesis protein n=1 Tax=Phenylobacterium sp. TaxID=1871053 RepID=UPI002B4A470B|nr:lipopolysaccharide biosynthesis protein [Phenylobacterium sp.]HKR87244.1 lipopolysaccharide biosynthesis protein [Phenylobacterium sp.]
MLSTKTIIGAGWLICSRLSGRLIDFGTVIFLARALAPADFGLAALAASLIAIVDTALEIPLTQALTRLKSIDDKHLDTAFTLGVCRGSVLSVVLFAFAWPFSLIYHDPRLAPLVCAFAIGPVARSLVSPAMVRFVREISFKQAFAVEISGKLTAATVAIALAHLGGGYWAIVANSVVAVVTTCILSHVIAPHRLRLSLARFSDFKGFVGWFSSAQLLAAASWQVDRGILGYFVSKATLGKYTMASDLSLLPTQSVIGPAMQPLMAALSRIADDRERLAKAYLRAATFTMMIAVPIGVGISLTSDLIVRVMLGAKWAETAGYLRWLALATMLSAAYQPMCSLALATNRPVVVFRFSLFEISVKALFVALGYYTYSLMGAVAGRMAVAVIMAAAVLLVARRMVGISLAAQLASYWRVAVAAGLMTALVLGLRHALRIEHLPDVVELGLTAVAGAAVYGGALFALGVRPPIGFKGRLVPQFQR